MYSQGQVTFWKKELFTALTQVTCMQAAAGRKDFPKQKPTLSWMVSTATVANKRRPFAVGQCPQDRFTSREREMRGTAVKLPRLLARGLIHFSAAEFGHESGELCNPGAPGSRIFRLRMATRCVMSSWYTCRVWGRVQWTRGQPWCDGKEILARDVYFREHGLGIMR